MSAERPARLRRDPRIERAAHRIDGGTRPRFDLAAAPGAGPAAVSATGRLRRDPRLEAERQLVAGTARRRLDRALREAALTAPTALIVHLIEPEIALTAPAPKTVIIADPACLIGVVPDAPGGRLTPHDRQLIGAARLLADAAGGAVVAFITSEINDLGDAGIDRAVALPASDDPAARAAALAGALRGAPLRHLLFPESADGGDLARRVAALTGEPLFAGAESVSKQYVTRAARGRRIEQRGAPPRLLTLAPDAVAPHGGGRHEALPIEIPQMEQALAGLAPAILSAAFIPADPASIPLAQADFVLSAGNGVSDFNSFRELARALGAAPGASRVVCDAGLMPRSAQVGASGTVLEATCYVALGIAGAPQHLQGVARCEHVVAVNTDLHAAMIERAGLAIVADAQKVMPALLDLLARERDETERRGES
ncbi:electron transfer flavoprotein subunit alpha/FixB family protein [Ancylobacter terrae]|uniref:electron transfer flavoprotein subunit alpha/FixB family protein n=1 Tax=Ancylobacter sp. sgz301288 TaxID=3342077 RepID=UPI0038597C9F